MAGRMDGLMETVPDYQTTRLPETTRDQLKIGSGFTGPLQRTGKKSRAVDHFSAEYVFYDNYFILCYFILSRHELPNAFLLFYFTYFVIGHFSELFTFFT